MQHKEFAASTYVHCAQQLRHMLEINNTAQLTYVTKLKKHHSRQEIKVWCSLTVQMRKNYKKTQSE